MNTSAPKGWISVPSMFPRVIARPVDEPCQLRGGHSLVWSGFLRHGGEPEHKYTWRKGVSWEQPIKTDPELTAERALASVGIPRAIVLVRNTSKVLTEAGLPFVGEIDLEVWKRRILQMVKEDAFPLAGASWSQWGEPHSKFDLWYVERP